MGQPRLFSARECADLFIYVFAGELECSRQVPQRPETILGEILLQLFDDGEIGIEHVRQEVVPPSTTESGGKTTRGLQPSRCVDRRRGC
jgi:hypothetical protein